MNRIINAIKDPKKVILYLLETPFGRLLPDTSYLRLKFRLLIGRRLDLKEPKTFNEKLQWLKLHNRRPEYTDYVDKYKVRDHIKETLGEEYLIPLLGVWDDPNDIDFSTLPDKFVLKCNHNSGLGMCICKDKSKLDIKKAKAELKKGLRQNYYLYGREWPYKDVERKIICEEYMEDESCNELKDYKLWCFDGKVEVILTCAERFSKMGLRENFYDSEWNLLDLRRPAHANTDYSVAKPQCLDKMIAFAEQLSRGLPFLRVDFYEVDKKLYFGELTFFPASGMEGFEPCGWDERLGALIKLDI